MTRSKAVLQRTTCRWAIAALLATFCLTSCTQSNPTAEPATTNATNAAQSPQTQEKKVILTTFTVIADMARNVAGDRAIVESLTKPGAEIHDYEPTPSDLIRAQQADLILDNGLGLERWAERFYGSLNDVPNVTISEGIEAIAIAEGNYQNRPNPHAWMSPQNALIYVENIRKALSEIDPANAATYSANAKAYSQQIEAIDQKLRTELAQLPEDQRYMATCEGAFTYLIRDYNLKEIYLWAVNSEHEGTPQQIRRAIDQVKSNQVPVVFCESTVNPEAQKQVAQEGGAKFGGVFYVDSLTDASGNAPTYLKLLEYNVSTLIQGLQGS
ncbi:metal ABC transporter substrate-binding protein [Microcoleus sp. FACHB-1515]|uniref:metal ABC transporter substrate-binding protein n=1 Tax=Cyanophyceae TaxID=3028117 RepID=UPI001684FE5F|nr:metal ABC transporter substrate-binding protein [Microcoleus sp. FACHB-1515]MBD2088631.1 metal ABC transporter substrate-binding protein [Microcoleus sp. FACHB-1515]